MAQSKKFVFAVPSMDCGYFTKGKRYLIASEDQCGFEIFDNDRELTYCTWNNSSHMRGGGFERVEKEI
jgi:hypothetical protein